MRYNYGMVIIFLVLLFGKITYAADGYTLTFTFVPVKSKQALMDVEVFLPIQPDGRYEMLERVLHISGYRSAKPIDNYRLSVAGKCTIHSQEWGWYRVECRPRERKWWHRTYMQAELRDAKQAVETVKEFSAP